MCDAVMPLMRLSVRLFGIWPTPLYWEGKEGPAARKEGDCYVVKRKRRLREPARWLTPPSARAFPYLRLFVCGVHLTSLDNAFELLATYYNY